MYDTPLEDSWQARLLAEEKALDKRGTAFFIVHYSRHSNINA